MARLPEQEEYRQAPPQEPINPTPGGSTPPRAFCLLLADLLI